MALANISLSDTFTLWLTRFNQLLSIGNAITEGQANTTGTLTISNPNYLNGNVSLNVSNGVIQVKGNTFDANAVTLTSNSQTLSITGSGKLGTTIYFNISALSTDVNDANTGNIASANSVNTAYAHVSDAFVWANTLAASSNAWSNAVFNYANTKFLANSSGAVFAGNLNIDRKSTRLNSSHVSESRMPSSA